MDNQQNKQGPQLQIEVSPDVAQGVYSNFAIISHTSSEFIVDLASMLPGVPKATVRSRVILSPEHAKRLAIATITGSPESLISRRAWKYRRTTKATNIKALAISNQIFPSHRNKSRQKTVYVNISYININHMYLQRVMAYLIRIIQLMFVPLQPKMVCQGMPTQLCKQLNNNIIIKKSTKCLQFRN